MGKSIILLADDTVIVSYRVVSGVIVLVGSDHNSSSFWFPSKVEMFLDFWRSSISIDGRAYGNCTFYMAYQYK